MMLKTSLASALLLALVACSSAPEASPEEANTGTSASALTGFLTGSDWMGTLPGMGTKRLNEISFPATHDSGTYDLVSVYERPVEDAFAPDATATLVKLGQFVGITDAWAKTQERTITEQLNDGIRAIDLRPCREKSGTLRICHGMYGPTMDDLLGQVKSFADAHPKEVILVYLGGFGGMESADHATLAEKVKLRLGNRLLRATQVQPTMSLSDVWAMNAGSVVVMYDKPTPPDASFVSPSAWEGSWEEVWDRDPKKASLEEAIAAQSSDKFFFLSGQATPTSDLIEAGMNFTGSYPSSVGKLADQTNPVVLGWVVNEWSSKRLNVLSFDFYDRTCLVKVALNRNGAKLPLDGCEIGTPTSWGYFAHLAYGRGAGSAMTCAAGQEMVAGLCYPKCAAGYTSPRGFPTVCAQACPSGYRDDGLTCFRDASIVSANTSACPWYDACGLTFSKGCSVCPSGYANDGCTCRRDPHMIVKTRYDRGAGKVPSSCGAGLEKDGLLCYPLCRDGYHGEGPICWPGT